MIAGEQEGFFFLDGAPRVGRPIQMGRRDGLGSAGSGLFRGAIGQPVLILLCGLHLDHLPGAIAVAAALPLLGDDRLRGFLHSDYRGDSEASSVAGLRTLS